MKMLRLILPCAAAFAISSFGLPAIAIPHATTPVNDATQDKLIGTGTLVKIEMLQTISSAHSKAGDKFTFRIVQNVMAGSRVAIPAMTQGSGKVLESRPARGGRNDGRLRVEFDPVALADGTNVKLAITRESLVADENEHNGTAGSVAEIADMTIPGFFILDFLRKGDNITLGAGAPFHVAVTEDAFLTQ
ncbi:MAG: hypothetical protein DLM53_11890 [Candidatus Eremiobacter antarcticus]|nr:hypothetical protein [Candidatus Eremiobacteraeota bacterium]MBC5808962.1 hypothetical protein [Candidatus Eremiobacteraeota bacterium]PZR60359.1 MAG: hypothetical protein DLM53_11890 [Candidatus Eremiobacter sp. RRmetagenome_bin22]